MITHLRTRIVSILFVAGILSWLGLQTPFAPAQQDTRAERLRLQNEEDRLNKEIAGLEGRLRDLKRFERHIIGLTDPKVILITVAVNKEGFGIPVSFPSKGMRSLDGVPFSISETQLDEIVATIVLDALLRGPGDKSLVGELKPEHLDKIKAYLLQKSQKIKRALEDETLYAINQETAKALQDLELKNAERDRVRADFARLTGQGGSTSDGRTYDDKGKRVFVSCGERAFADEFVGRTPGNPEPKGPSGKDPKGALKRDYDGVKDTGYYTLGCRGSITLSFSQIYLVDGPGLDLYVFEIGPDVEGTRLEIKTENGPWIPVGEIGGGAVQVDIHDALARRGMQDQRFTQVRLTDLGQKCAGNWPGADIDAIAALNCVVR